MMMMMMMMMTLGRATPRIKPVHPLAVHCRANTKLFV